VPTTKKELSKQLLPLCKIWQPLRHNFEGWVTQIDLVRWFVRRLQLLTSTASGFFTEHLEHLNLTIPN
jgi:hypothetical protein